MHKRYKKSVRVFVRSFWATVLFVVIGLAVMVQLGRLAFPVLSDYRVVLEAFVSDRVGADVQFGALQADWHGLTPEISIQNLQVSYQGRPVFAAEAAELEWNLLATIRDWRLGLRKLRFKGLAATFEQDTDGQWRISGLPNSTASSSGEPIIDDPVDIFVFGRRLELLDTQFTLHLRTGSAVEITVPKIQLENDNVFHRLQAELAVEGAKAFSLVVEGHGDPRNETSFSAKGFMQSEGFDLQKVLSSVRQSGVFSTDAEWMDSLPTDGAFNLALWFDGTLRSGLRFSGRSKVDAIVAPIDASIQWPTTIATEFKGYWGAGTGWQVSFVDANARWENYQSPTIDLQVSGGTDLTPTILGRGIDIEQWVEVAFNTHLLPERAEEVLRTLSPKGILRTLEVTLTDKDSGYFALAAELANGSVEAWQGAPALTGVSGFVAAKGLDGHVLLNNRSGFGMNFPQIYDNPMSFTAAEGDIRWTIYPEEEWVGVSSGQLTLERADMIGRGLLNLRLPFKHDSGLEPEMTLIVGVKEAPVEYHTDFVPNTAPADLRAWLGKAVQGGYGTDIAFIYHGTLLKNSEQARAVQLFATVNEGKLAFDPNWPSLTGASAQMLLDDERFSVSRLTGQLADNQIENGAVSLVSLPDHHHALDIRADAKGQSQNLLGLLLRSPVKKQLDSSLEAWKIKGDYAANMALRVPLSKDGEMAQTISLKLRDNTLGLGSPDLTFSGLSGKLNYSDSKGLSASKLKATFWNNPMTASIKTLNEHGLKSLAIDFGGEINVRDLQSWTKRPELTYASGKSAVQGQVIFPFKTDVSMRVSLKSSLQGITMDLPQPLTKLAEQSLTTEFELTRHSTSAGRAARSDYRLSFDGTTTQVLWQEVDHQWAGATVALNQKLVKVQPGVLRVEGMVQEAAGLKWYETLLGYAQLLEQPDAAKQDEPPAAAVANEPFTPIQVDLRFGALQVGSAMLEKIRLQAMREENAWFIEFANLGIAGNIRAFNDVRPLQIKLDYLKLPGRQSGGEGASKSALAELVARDLKPADVTIQSLSFNDVNYGQWQFKLRPNRSGAVIYDLFADLNGLRIQGHGGRGAELVWLQRQNHQSSYFSGELVAGDIGEAIENLYGEKILISKSADIDVDLQWQGAPDEMAISKLEGLVELKILRGRFVRGATAAENPLLKLIGLLNFDTLARRLRLDFSDLNPEGMAYDSVKGELVFTAGHVRIKNPLNVDTPSSQLQFVGDINLDAQTVDAKLVATLPLAGNLTVAAALTGGIPTAVTVFLLGKLFKRQMNKASSIRYEVTGSWNDPSVKFDKVFESKASSSTP